MRPLLTIVSAIKLSFQTIPSDSPYITLYIACRNLLYRLQKFTTKPAYKPRPYLDDI